MSAFQITLSIAQYKTLCKGFGQALIEKAMTKLPQETRAPLESALAEQLAQIGKTPTSKPVKAKKKLNQMSGLAKRALKRRQLNKELVALGGKSLPKANVTELRKQIAWFKKVAKIQLKVDATVKEILSYVALNKLNAADEKSLRKRVKEVDEHCSSALLDGVTMAEMKDILKEQKKLHRKVLKSAKKN